MVLQAFLNIWTTTTGLFVSRPVLNCKKVQEEDDLHANGAYVNHIKKRVKSKDEELQQNAKLENSNARHRNYDKPFSTF